MTVKIGINGFGRIGRHAFRASLNQPEIEVVAVNDITDAKTLAHLLQYDSTYGKFHAKVAPSDGFFMVDGRKLQVCAEKDPSRLPWKALGVDVVIESTGLFTDAQKAKVHLDAGAKKVIISAPAKGEDITVCMGVNETRYDPQKHHILSNASCTTNCLAPVAKVLHESFGVVKALMSTIHAFTNDQKILDLPHSDLRRARSAGLSIIPTTTGAAKAVSLVVPELKGKFDGMAYRVPTPTVSVVDLIALVQKKTTVEEINKTMEKASQNMKGILEVSYEPLVSADFRGTTASSIVDAALTQVIDGDLVKVVSWYDNEWAYSNRLIDLAVYVAKRGFN